MFLALEKSNDNYSLAKEDRCKVRRMKHWKIFSNVHSDVPWSHEQPPLVALMGLGLFEQVHDVAVLFLEFEMVILKWKCFPYLWQDMPHAGALMEECLISVETSTIINSQGDPLFTFRIILTSILLLQL
jgi:hypothetical protein